LFVLLLNQQAVTLRVSKEERLFVVIQKFQYTPAILIQTMIASGIPLMIKAAWASHREYSDLSSAITAKKQAAISPRNQNKGARKNKKGMRPKPTGANREKTSNGFIQIEILNDKTANRHTSSA
jgi:hypothetical protein